MTTACLISFRQTSIQSLVALLSWLRFWRSGRQLDVNGLDGIVATCEESSPPGFPKLLIFSSRIIDGMLIPIRWGEFATYPMTVGERLGWPVILDHGAKAEPRLS